MLKITAAEHKVINSSALIKEHLFDIDYGIEVVNEVDGSISFVDIDGNPAESLRMTSAGQDILWNGLLYKKR